jgi:Flp pilus assembly protein TadB
MDKPESEAARGSLMSLLLAAFFGLAILVGLFFITLGAVGPIVVIGGGVFALAAFHYIVWGWWLSRYIRDEVAEEDREKERRRE